MGSGRVTLPGGLEVVVGAGTSTNPIHIPDSTPPTPTVVRCFQCQSTEHVRPQCPEYICPFCRMAAPGHPQRTCLMCSCPICGELGHGAPVAQPQPQLTHPLPEWLTEGMFESGSRSNDGGNVTVEEPPIPFSPFSSVDCTMLDHFSFNDFVAIAFPDIAGDLDIQI